MAARLFGGYRTMMAAAAKSGAEATAAAGKKAKGGIGKPVPVSAQLSKFLGANEASRSDAVKKIWQYIRQHDLQNPANKREIRCDDKLKTIFNGKDSVGFLEIAKLLSQHFVKSA
ncbi:SWIB domain-containing protein [Citrus sinensis]|uniref:SWIB domain-containing protein n=2 Tax=Citrus sinensis TaxID=2711 RepID=A0ACB8K3Z3_CITSI|nr:SWIB domain-containing protein [Citrus sinensis]KDO72266.1 hypothetical protein CISIN_1g048564mg [Citrus sinensis]